MDFPVCVFRVLWCSVWLIVLPWPWINLTFVLNIMKKGVFNYKCNTYLSLVFVMEIKATNKTHENMNDLNLDVCKISCLSLKLKMAVKNKLVNNCTVRSRDMSFSTYTILEIYDFLFMELEIIIRSYHVVGWKINLWNLKSFSKQNKNKIWGNDVRKRKE